MGAGLASMEIRLEGFPRLQAAFNGLPIQIQRKCLRPALRAGAKVIRRHVAVQAPKSGIPPHMGDIQNLKIKAMKRDRSKRGRLGFVVITAKRPELGITNQNTYYPAHVEYGYLAGAATQGPVETGGRYHMRYDEATGKWVRSHKNDAYSKGADRTFRQGARRHVPANPFMKRGLEAGRAEANLAIAEELFSQLKSAAGLDQGVTGAEFFSDDIGSDESADVF